MNSYSLISLTPEELALISTRLLAQGIPLGDSTIRFDQIALARTTVAGMAALRLDADLNLSSAAKPAQGLFAAIKGFVRDIFGAPALNGRHSLILVPESITADTLTLGLHPETKLLSVTGKLAKMASGIIPKRHGPCTFSSDFKHLNIHLRQAGLPAFIQIRSLDLYSPAGTVSLSFSINP